MTLEGDYLTIEDGSYLTTENDDRIFLGRWYLTLDFALLSFATLLSAVKGTVAHYFVTFNATALLGPGVTAEEIGFLTKKTNRALQASLALAGAYSSENPGHLLLATLSFSGALTKRTSYALSSTLPFSGYWFTGNRAFKDFEATLSFSGAIVKLISKIFTAAVLFFVSFAAEIPTGYTKLFTAELRFRGGIFRTWSEIRVWMVLIATHLQSIVRGFLNFRFKPPLVIDSLQTIPTTPTVIDLGVLAGETITLLYIINRDTERTVEVDLSSAFDKFPQLIGPESAVLLKPYTSSSVYARSDSGTPEIRVIACN